jgi:PAS domain S-box-containing protein
MAPDMPVIVLAGHDDEAGGLEAVRRGAQDCLLKDDIKGRELSRAIRYAIERKHAEADLVALTDVLEQRTRALALSNSTIFGDSYTAILQLAHDTTAISANRAMSLLVGAPELDLTGRRTTDLFSDPDAPEIASRVINVFDTGIPHRRDALLVRDDGTTRLTALQLSRVTMDESGTYVILMTVGDITAGSRAMLAHANDQKLAEVGRLAAGLAHEIRSPLQYIATSVEFARSSVAKLFDGRRELSYPETQIDLTESLGEVADGIAAVNRARITSFLTKPVAPDELLRWIDQAVTQHSELVKDQTDGAEILEDSAAALMETLAIANPTAYWLTKRVTNLIDQYLESHQRGDAWELSIAARLSYLGSAALGADLSSRVLHGDDLAVSEDLLVGCMAGLTVDIVARIPRLDHVEHILRHHRSPATRGSTTGDLEATQVLGVITCLAELEAVLCSRTKAAAELLELEPSFDLELVNEVLDLYLPVGEPRSDIVDLTDGEIEGN